MSGAAWLMLGVTWAVIGFITGRFFLKVLKTPQRGGDDDPGAGRPSS